MTKHLILIIFAVMCVATGRSQSADQNLHQWSMTVPAPQDTATLTGATATPLTPDYKLTPEWKKSRRLKRAAWITFGVGAFIAAGGTAAGFISFAAGSGDTGPTAILWLTSWTVGGASILASIPLFFTAQHFKNKARESVDISLTATQIGEPTPSGRLQLHPALGLALTF